MYRETGDFSHHLLVIRNTGDAGDDHAILFDNLEMCDFEFLLFAGSDHQNSTRLERLYEEWIENYSLGEVLVLDSDRLDFVTPSEFLVFVIIN